ncbi:MAG: hypothetical protein JXX14_17375 [Deltaproteobacteria bacterium]|nr:hypothetical protein [Deltaproteobacteria bacterium]
MITRIIFLAGLFGGILCSTCAMAGNGKKAVEDFNAGTALFEKREYVAAADKFRASYALKPSYKILYNIGQAEAAAKRYGISLQAFEQYLSDGGDDIAQTRQNEVRDEIKRLRDITGIIEVAAPDGVEVFIDGVSRGLFPASRRIPVAASVVHEIYVRTGDGAQLPAIQASVSGGDSVTVDFTVREADPPAESAAPTAQAQSVADVAPLAARQGSNATSVDSELNPSKSLFVSGLVIGGIGVASLIAGGVFGGLALSKNASVKTVCEQGICENADRQLVESRDQFAVLNTVFLITGGVLTATGVVLLVVSKKKRERLSDANISLLPVPFGVSLTGRF